MKKYFAGYGLALVMAMFVVAGCSLIQFGDGAKAVNDGVPVVSGAVEGVVGVVEDATGKPLVSPETAEKGEDVSNKVTSAANVGKIAVETARNFLPEDAKPYATATSLALGAVIAIGGAASEFFRKRATKEAKQAKTVAKAVIVGVTDLPGAGVAITNAAKAAGVADAVELTYREAVVNGEIIPGSSTATSNAA